MGQTKNHGLMYAYDKQGHADGKNNRVNQLHLR